VAILCTAFDIRLLSFHSFCISMYLRYYHRILEEYRLLNLLFKDSSKTFQKLFIDSWHLLLLLKLASRVRSNIYNFSAPKIAFQNAWVRCPCVKILYRILR